MAAVPECCQELDLVQSATPQPRGMMTYATSGPARDAIILACQGVVLTELPTGLATEVATLTSHLRRQMPVSPSARCSSVGRHNPELPKPKALPQFPGQEFSTPSEKPCPHPSTLLVAILARAAPAAVSLDWREPSRLQEQYINIMTIRRRTRGLRASKNAPCMDSYSNLLSAQKTQ